VDVRLAAGDLAEAVEHLAVDVSLAAGHPAAGAWEALSLHIESQACPNRRQSTVVGRPVERESCAREPWALLKAPPWRVLEAMATLVGPSLPCPPYFQLAAEAISVDPSCRPRVWRVVVRSREVVAQPYTDCRRWMGALALGVPNWELPRLTGHAGSEWEVLASSNHRCLAAGPPAEAEAAQDGSATEVRTPRRLPVTLILALRGVMAMRDLPTAPQSIVLATQEALSCR